MGQNKGIKKLVSFGCSFVEGAAITDKVGHWVGKRYAFPTTMSYELGVTDYINYGHSGYGNESILRSIHRHFKQDIDHSDTLVIIGLSGITRYEIYSNYQQKHYDNHLFDYRQSDILDYKRRAKKWLGKESLWKDIKTYIHIEQKYFFDLDSKQEKLQWQISHLDGYFKNKGIKYVLFNSIEDNLGDIKKDINFLSLVDINEHKGVSLTGITNIEDTWNIKLRLQHYYNVNNDYNIVEHRRRTPPYGKYFCAGHPSPNAHKELANTILKYIDENNI